MSRSSIFCVGDHDFTKFSIVPSVTFFFDIPESIELSWYTGHVIVGLKDAVFEPASPAHHSAELHSSILSQKLHEKSMFFLYSDGGPDHRLTYLSVQLIFDCFISEVGLGFPLCL